MDLEFDIRFNKNDNHVMRSSLVYLVYLDRMKQTVCKLPKLPNLFKCSNRINKTPAIPSADTDTLQR